MKFLLVVAVVLAVCALFAKPLRARTGKPAPDAKYKGRAIMSDNEMEFFGRLVAALPEHYIFPQVAMSALLESGSGDRKRAHSEHNRIAQQRIDYVVCNRRCEVVAVVELDDRTHSAAKDKVRDGRLEQGGFRTVRFQSRQKPPAGAIRAAILPSTPAPILDSVVAG